MLDDRDGVGPGVGSGRWRQSPTEELIDDLRQGLIAAGLFHDAWWSEAHATAGDYARKRAAKLDDARVQVAALGPQATLDQVCQAIRPLLGEFWRPDELNTAIRGLAATAINRVAMIREARDWVLRWDAENHPPSSVC